MSRPESSEESKADLILHPVRWRILQTIGRGRLTARDMAPLLPDVPQATLYRHIGKLARAGILRTVEERQVRGTVERVYALSEEGSRVSEHDLANARPEDHMRYFGAFVASLLADFGRYLQRGNINLRADGVGYSQAPLNLTDEEFTELTGSLREVILSYSANGPAPGRTRRLISLILMPAAESAGSEPAQDKSHKGNSEKEDERN